jgi:hypothetical protein
MPITRARQICGGIEVMRPEDLSNDDVRIIGNSSKIWCKGAVDQDYINRQLFSGNIDYVVLSRYTDGRLCGFVLLQFLEDSYGPYIYIDVVCASTLGYKRPASNLILGVEKIANDMNIRMLKLSALPHVIKFYKDKFGYMETDYPCRKKQRTSRKGNMIDGYRMTKCLN